MIEHNWLDLQLFGGEGAGEGGGEGAASGETSADAGQDSEARLLALGVPREKLRRRAKKAGITLPEGAVRSQPEAAGAGQQAAAAEEETEEHEAPPAPARMSWEEIMADPEYNRQMQSVVQSRLKTAKADQETLAKLAPALEVLARKYSMDPDSMDYDALARAINEDSDFYEDRAIELNIPVETAKRLDQLERENARRRQQETQTLEQQRIQQHIRLLEQQGEALKKVFPSFDLRAELQNPVFARMTSPGVGISVEDAYHAVHRKEIQVASMQATAQQTARKLSNAIQSGQRRPAENGTSAQAPSVTTFDYRKATKEQRAELKEQIRRAAARGEKLYPGR